MLSNQEKTGAHHAYSRSTRLSYRGHLREPGILRRRTQQAASPIPGPSGTKPKPWRDWRRSSTPSSKRSRPTASSSPTNARACSGASSIPCTCRPSGSTDRSTGSRPSFARPAAGPGRDRDQRLGTGEDHRAGAAPRRSQGRLRAAAGRGGRALPFATPATPGVRGTDRT